MPTIKNYYKILGVDESASAEQIKKAYRNLAKKYHPDKSQGDQSAEERFKEISAAYNVLSNPNERKKYDAMKSNPFVHQPGSGNNYDPYIDFNPFTNVGKSGTGKPPRGDFEDIFKKFFGSGFSFYDDPFEKKTSLDQKARISITFEQALRGGSIIISAPGKEKIRLKLKPGLTEGSVLKVKGKGHFNPFTKKRGDLLIKVVIKPHPVFKLSGKNIIVSISITPDQALRGTTIQIKDAWGERIRLKIPANTITGKNMRIKAHGVKSDKGIGDMIISVIVKAESGTKKEI